MSENMKVLPAQELKLTPIPITPEWILEGNSEANWHVTVQSEDKIQTTGIWECSAGKFNFFFPWDESSHILEGEVTIEEEGGKTYTLRAGDFAHFPIGTRTTWTVEKYIRKVFFLVTPDPLEL